jgi:hypothetical protein
MGIERTKPAPGEGAAGGERQVRRMVVGVGHASGRGRWDNRSGIAQAGIVRIMRGGSRRSQGADGGKCNVAWHLLTIATRRTYNRGLFARFSAAGRSSTAEHGGDTASTGVKTRGMHAERHRLVNPVEHNVTADTQLALAA